MKQFYHEFLINIINYGHYRAALMLWGRFTWEFASKERRLARINRANELLERAEELIAKMDTPSADLVAKLLSNRSTEKPN